MAPQQKYQQLMPDSEEDPPPGDRGARKLCWDSLMAVLVLLMVGVLLLLATSRIAVFGAEGVGPQEASSPRRPPGDACRLTVVESIPEGMDYGPNGTVSPTVFGVWTSLITEATRTVDIASFYWTLTNSDTGTTEPSASQGEKILQELMSLSSRVSVRIVVNKPSKSSTTADLNSLTQRGAKVRVVDFPKLTSGVLHTKFWIVDKKHIFVGSPNMDWRSLTQVKELGAVVYNCSSVAQDLEKIFEEYWFLGAGGDIPTEWPLNYSTKYNSLNPLHILLNNTPAQVYLSSSPPALSARGRTDDLKAILSIIADASEFVYVAVMDYIPVSVYSHPQRFWPDIDTALRRAAFDRRVTVRLLVSCWKHTDPIMFPFLKSLAALGNRRLHLEVRMFFVPTTEEQKRIPYGRVNHNKYLVTDRVGYIGTSNWSGDYFSHTAGVGLSVNQTGSEGGPGVSEVSKQLKDIFERDWNSQYSTKLDGLGDNWDTVCQHTENM
uniref:Phospholipase D3 n=1 Tax=Callorhinchus milii TaxID=7868 RepID=V9KS85_CALMI